MSQCSAHNRQGKPCGRQAMTGGAVCDLHGGKSPGARQRAAQRRAEAGALRALDREGVEPVRDPVGALQQLAGEVLRLKDILAERVAELQSWRYESRLGAEQLRAELGLLERAQDRAGRLLLDLAKLGLDERAARLTEQQAALMAASVRAALAACGLEDRIDLLAAIADEMRTVGSGERLRSEPGRLA